MKAWLVLLLFGASLRGQQQLKLLLPDETAGFDRIVQTLVSAFDHVDIVALGESHWRKVDSDLRIALVRNPEFAQKVRFIVVEFGSTAQQPTLELARLRAAFCLLPGRPRKNPHIPVNPKFRSSVS